MGRCRSEPFDRNSPSQSFTIIFARILAIVACASLRAGAAELSSSAPTRASAPVHQDGADLHLHLLAVATTHRSQNAREFETHHISSWSQGLSNTLMCDLLVLPRGRRPTRPSQSLRRTAGPHPSRRTSRSRDHCVDLLVNLPVVLLTIRSRTVSSMSNSTSTLPCSSLHPGRAAAALQVVRRALSSVHDDILADLQGNSAHNDARVDLVALRLGRTTGRPVGPLHTRLGLSLWTTRRCAGAPSHGCASRLARTSC